MQIGEAYLAKICLCTRPKINKNRFYFGSWAPISVRKQFLNDDYLVPMQGRRKCVVIVFFAQKVTKITGSKTVHFRSHFEECVGEWFSSEFLFFWLTTGVGWAVATIHHTSPASIRLNRKSPRRRDRRNKNPKAETDCGIIPMASNECNPYFYEVSRFVLVFFFLFFFADAGQVVINLLGGVDKKKISKTMFVCMAFLSVRLVIDSTVSRQNIISTASTWPKSMISTWCIAYGAYFYDVPLLRRVAPQLVPFYFHSSFAETISYALLRTLNAHLEQHIDHKINKPVSALLRPKGCCSCKFLYLKSL